MKNSNEVRRVVKCAVNQDQYCLDISYVISIRQADALKAENSIDGICGVVQHHDKEIPTFRLDQLLGYESATRANREHILILGTDLGECGLMVSGLSRAISLPSNRFAPLPKLVTNADQPFFLGAVDFSKVGLIEQTTNETLGSIESQDLSQPTAVETLATVQEQVALLLSPNGLFAPESTQPVSPFTAAPLEIQTAQSNSHDNRQMIVFGMPHIDSFGDKACIALSVTQVLEVIQDTECIRVPGAPDNILGITKWRDHYVTVVDVPRVLGFDSMPPSTRHRIVIARRNDGQLVGFHTDIHMHTVRLPLQAAPVDDLPENTNAKMFRACFRTRDEGILMIPAIDQFAHMAI